MRDKLNRAVYGARRSAIREYSALAAATPGCIRLTLGEPEADTPLPVRRRAQAALEAGETHYIPNNGSPALLERIAAFEREKNGMDYAPGEIMVTAGATEALFVALFGILNPGDEVVIPVPAFVLYEEIVKLCRGVPVMLDTAPAMFRIDGKALKRCLSPRTKAVILNTPNNPTGCVYSRESLDAVYAAVRDRDIFVICDDVYRQLAYTEDCRSFAEYRDLRDRLLVVQSFSKPYAMTGWRMGYLMCDAPVKERLELIHQFAVVSTPAPFQAAAAEALDYDPSELRERYRVRRDYVTGRLRDMGLTVPQPEGAFYVFPSIEQFGIPSGEFCARMIREAGVAAVPGFCFGGEGHIRLSYCCGDHALREGLDRMERFLRTLS
ncbi:MAG: aminotransferase class I/II-fold pyridoxal phosphate-dependent enzyme [Oscillospiraceae bacterium]|nr:aminotransferase class I/II-fold pyridoxal phosphate-dependent enzyme [Oscillospiraceae bacterium]